MTLMRPASRTLSVSILMVAAILVGAAGGLLGVCGPFTDVAADAFCPFVLEIFTLGITTGTSPTTYDPAATVNRLQMAAFLSRTVDGVLKRGGRRAAMNLYATTETNASLALTTVGSFPSQPVSDGLDIWVANSGGSSVSRVRASDGGLLETWTGATSASGILWALGRVFASGNTNPGRLYRIDGSQPAGAVTTVASTLGSGPASLAYDGSRIWSANLGGSVSIVTPGAAIPWTVTTVTAGFGEMHGVLFDGANIWVTDGSVNNLLYKLNAAGAILQTVTVGSDPGVPVFDGANIWVPNLTTHSVSVVRASSGAILATLTGNGLNTPRTAAFDGQRVLVTNIEPGADSVSLWKAADLTPIGVFGTGPGTKPFGACSDGINFWVTLSAVARLARF